MEYFIDVIIG